MGADGGIEMRRIELSGTVLTILQKGGTPSIPDNPVYSVEWGGGMRDLYARGQRRSSGDSTSGSVR